MTTVNVTKVILFEGFARVMINRDVGGNRKGKPDERHDRLRPGRDWNLDGDVGGARGVRASRGLGRRLSRRDQVGLCAGPFPPRRRKNIRDGGRSAGCEFSKTRSGRRIDEIVVNHSRLKFKLAAKSGNYQFAGTITEDGSAIEGHVDTGKNRVPFRFDRTAGVELKQYVGTYDLGRGRLIHLRPWVELGLKRNALMFIDSGSRRVGVLFARSKRMFRGTERAGDLPRGNRR